MNKFVPHKIDSESSFESGLLGDVKAGFPSPAEDIREKLDLIKVENTPALAKQARKVAWKACKR